jgi:outer membrane receptor protein involved in Fe transport
MKKITNYLVTFLLANILCITVLAQNTTISGNVRNSSTKENAGAVSVTLKDGTTGTYTDDKGNFKLSVKTLPVTLLVSSIGYELQEITVSNTSKVQIDFIPSNALGQEIVVSASRVPQRILESPVSIERINTTTIRNAPAVTYYDVISSLKGVDITTSSLTFKTPTTRGFSGSGSPRVTQFMDGMDNQLPGLNFSAGSVIGLTELDVDNVELLPGASSALYGPGGMNGTILIASKNPFKYQGLSFQVKTGIMNTDKRYRSASPYNNWSMRWAKKVSEKFAFKIGTEIVAAKDWLGYDRRNYDRNGTLGSIKAGDRATDPNYDGVNIYGDETTIDIRTNVLNPIGASAAPFLKNFIDTLNNGRPINVSRTGYAESDIVNPNTINYKVSGALHYKITPKIEAVLAGHWGTGNTVYTGSERYSLRDFKIGQYKFELNSKNWFLKAYTTQENAGESFNATVTTRLTNEAWKPSGGPTGWYAQYAQFYLGARLNGATDFDAQTFARQVTDFGRPAAGSAAFKTLFDKVRSVPISAGGGLFVDRSDLYMVEGQYNLSSITHDFADILIGANFKQYALNSEGTLFADQNQKISINEFGGYIQATRSFLEDKIKVALSGRYDKNENFVGRFTPRATAVIKVAKNNNIRVSYQTAYRFPTTQQQWIDLGVGSNTRLLGGAEYFNTTYQLSTKPTFELAALPTTTSAYQVNKFKAESVSTYEIGYKGLLMNDKLLIDAYGYFGEYKDFLTRTLLIQPTSGNVADVVNALANKIPVSNVGNIYSIPVNSSGKVKTFGWGFSLDYRLPSNFSVSGNVYSDELKDVPTNFVAYFSTPKYRTNVSIANSGFGPKKKLGFNVSYRWQDAFLYQADFANDFIPAVHTVDAQVSLKLPKTKSILKLGANNLLNQYYVNAPGNSIVGGLYYVSFAYNVF